MSRIGRSPIAIPEGVEVTVDKNLVTVKGKLGQLQEQIHPNIKVSIKESTDSEDNNSGATGSGKFVLVERPNELKLNKSLHGLSRTLIANMIIGVTEGYKKELQINGVGYRAQKQGSKLNLTLGFSHPVIMEDTEDVKTSVPQPNQIFVEGINKQKVGQYAAEIRAKRPPEPYKGKGVKYIDEHIIRKEGKSGAKSA